MLRSLLIKAQTGWSVPDNVTTSTCTIMTTPSAPLRRLRAFFLLAQPRLLFQEGNTLSWQFIHTFVARQSRNQKGHSPQRRREILLNLLVGCCHRFRRFLKTEYDALNAFSQ